MSNLKKTHEPIRQNGETVKKSQKYDVNLRKNSSLYFQIGLIFCLLAAYGLLEMKFETTKPKICTLTPDTAMFMAEVLPFTPEVEKDEVPVKKQLNPETEEIKEVPDETPDIFPEAPEKPTTTTTVSKPLYSGDIKVNERPEGPDNVNFETIEFVSIYPGCENKKSNEEKRKCMSEKITQLIQKKFNTNLGSDLGLSGKQVIRTQFKIDKTGHVSDIQVRGSHAELEKEATRVINILPEMTPGRQRDKNVGVIYTLPIVFQVE